MKLPYPYVDPMYITMMNVKMKHEKNVKKKKLLVSIYLFDVRECKSKKKNYETIECFVS